MIINIPKTKKNMNIKDMDQHHDTHHTWDIQYTFA